MAPSSLGAISHLPVRAKEARRHQRSSLPVIEPWQALFGRKEVASNLHPTKQQWFRKVACLSGGLVSHSSGPISPDSAVNLQGWSGEPDLVQGSNQISPLFGAQPGRRHPQRLSRLCVPRVHLVALGADAQVPGGTPYVAPVACAAREPGTRSPTTRSKHWCLLPRWYIRCLANVPKTSSSNRSAPHRPKTPTPRAIGRPHQVLHPGTIARGAVQCEK